MEEYAIISGSNILALVKAKNIRSAGKKAVRRLAEEYKRKYDVRILRFARKSPEKEDN